MTKRSLFVVLVFVIILNINFSKDGYAMVVDSLYTIELQAADKTLNERNALFLQSFEQVLLRLVREPSISTMPSIQVAKEQIDKYVSSFLYKDILDSNTNALFKLKITFNEKMINSLLKEANIPYLGKNRPVILTWLLVEANNGFKLAGEQEQEFFISKLEKLAIENSIPLVFPLLDIEDLSKIQNIDVFNSGTISFEEFSIKYNADLILIGKVSHFAGQWYGKWNMLGNNYSEWNINATELDELYNQLVNILKINLINNYAANIADQNNDNVINMKIMGISSIENYFNILNYLKGLSLVSLVKVIEITDNDMVFGLNIHGEKERILKAIRRDKILEECFDDDYADRQQALYYKVKS